MGDGEWLSTRNRKKVTQPQPRIQKRRISTSKPMKSTRLQMSHSPPPRQLFTATKQSSLNQFFSTSEDHDFEVEVNFDDDSQKRCVDQITNHAFSETGKSELRRPDQKRCENLYTDMCKRNSRYEDSGLFEKESKNFVVNSFKSDTKTKEEEEITSEYIPTSVDEEVNKRTVEFEELKEVNDVLHVHSFERTDLEPETEDSNCLLGNKKSVYRKRYGSELIYDLGPSVKRKKTDAVVFKNNLELTDCTTRCNKIELVEQNDASEQTNVSYSRAANLKHDSVEDADRITECDVVSQELSVPVSYFSSQSLHLDSQLSLTSQQSVLETDFTLTLDTENEVKATILDKTDLLEKDLSENSQSLSSQSVRVESVSLDIPFTLNSQSEHKDNKNEHSLSSASLDLSDQSDSLFLGTEENEIGVIAPNDLQTDSQLSFESSSPDQQLQFESLQLP